MINFGIEVRNWKKCFAIKIFLLFVLFLKLVFDCGLWSIQTFDNSYSNYYCSHEHSSIVTFVVDSDRSSSCFPRHICQTSMTRSRCRNWNTDRLVPLTSWHLPSVLELHLSGEFSELRMMLSQVVSNIFGFIYNFYMSVSLVQDVVKKGINYIDTAPWYGQGRSEEVLGKALK